MKKMEQDAQKAQKQTRRSVRKPREEAAKEKLDAFVADQHRQRDAMLKLVREEKPSSPRSPASQGTGSAAG